MEFYGDREGFWSFREAFKKKVWIFSTTPMETCVETHFGGKILLHMKSDKILKKKINWTKKCGNWTQDPPTQPRKSTLF